MYKILLERGAEKDLNALDSPLRKRIIDHLLSLRINPRPQGVKRLTGSKTAWRLRVGDWRIIYEVNNRKKEAEIYRIKHRSRAY